MTTRTYDSQPAISSVQADSLRPDEVDELRRAINGVRSGETEYLVLLTNRKQTNSKKRLPGTHYDAHPALAAHAHKGWLVAAPLNARGEIYLHIYDEARAQERGKNFGHTRVTLKGLRSFEILRERPGPLADPDETVAAGSAQTFVGFDPQAAMANALFLQAQALTLMGQAMIAWSAQPSR